jgi:tetratricopeptide (TPR) repeat protein
MSWKNLFRRNKRGFSVDKYLSPAETGPKRPYVNPELETARRLEAAKQLHREGNVAEAEAVYLDIVRNDPGHADAQHMIGVARLERGRPADAEQYLRDAIALDDTQANFHSNLGNALVAQNRIEEAYESFQRALSLNPEHMVALSNSTTALLSMGRSGEAKALCTRMLAIEPEDIDARRSMAAALMEEGDTHGAIATLREGLEIRNRDFGLLVQLASALELVNQLDEAATVIARAEAVSPGVARVSLLAGLIARRQGNFELARQHLQAAIDQGLPEREEIEAFNQLGLALDAMGDAAAFAAFKRSNQAMARFTGAQNLDGDRFLREVAALREFFTQEKFTDLRRVFPPDDDLRPVFFVGFPRSGTTLMEQVLKAHPGIVTTDEVSPLHAVTTVIERSGGYPRGLDRLASRDISRLRQYFRDFCRDNIGDLEGKRLVDKLPLNILHLGLAKLLFPEAKIVVALRDPRDACMSCFMQKFKLNDAMANFLEIGTTGLAYEAVMGLWLHYRSILAGSWMEYRYEDLVDNFDDTVSKVLDFIGVGWHEEISNYRQAAKQRAITTPSYRDVTAPVDDHAVARWRRYERQLAPIFPVLAPFVETFGYE